MQKRILSLVCFPFIVCAQLFNQGYLVNSNEIGNDLLLFVPDSAVQILRNPARATKFDGGFVYISKFNQSSRYVSTIPGWNPVNYKAYRTTNNIFWRPTLFSNTGNVLYNISAINLAYMFGTSEIKWLLKIVSLDKNYDSENFDHKTDEDFDNFLREVRESHSESQSKFHNISINRTGSFDFVDFSLGLSIGMGDSDYRYNFERKYIRDYRLDSELRHYNDSYISNDYENLKNLFIGINLNLFTNDWEVISSLYYIESDYQKLEFFTWLCLLAK